MLNYIWASLIAIGIFTAIGTDIYNEANDTFRNGKEFVATINNRSEDLNSKFTSEFLIDKNYFNSFFGKNILSENQSSKITIIKNKDGKFSFSIPINKTSPKIWQDMSFGAKNKEQLSGEVKSISFDKENHSTKIILIFEKISYLKIRAITQATFQYASIAVELAIGLIGIMALWLGVMSIADKTGVLLAVTKLLTPITKKLFPDVPSDHPAIGAMIMNISANMLGLNNAATPLGLKAMEELNKLNTKVGTATNAMCTFLVINTSGLTLIPATVIAIRASMGSSDPGIIIGTSIFGAGCATFFGILAVKFLQRLKIFNKEDA